ncbi:MAG: GDSL-type esterase/lipase family protein [Dysgonamonadaceae bacterium]|jgi:lysophospholipase L1-like esterase|nr:GDSL-type esterase/lipase family protein [Dysgonamonadaceae bacterium]
MKNTVKFLFLLLCCLSFATLIAQDNGNTYRRLNIVYIGNSITISHGLQRSPPDAAAKNLENAGYAARYVNCGLSGSNTVDWLPGGNLFSNAVNAANQLDATHAQLVFSLMLGTNDSAIQGTNGAPVSTTTYKQNLLAIIDALREHFPDSKFVLNRPSYYTPNTHNATRYLQEGLDRLQSYFPVIKSIIAENPNCIFEGDTTAFSFFKANYLQYLQAEAGNSGTFYLHPNQAGADKLGEFWANGMKPYLESWGVAKQSLQRIKVACIGNSITENAGVAGKYKYPEVLQQLLGDGYDLKNYGIGMRTMLSKGDYPYINEQKYRDALAWRPDIVIIKLGTNDAKDYNWVHKNEFQQDYINFINSFKNLPNSPKIFVCYPIPVYPNNWLDIPEDRYINEMFPMISAAAQATGATLIDLYTPLLGHEELTYDKVHPNFRGTTLMAHLIGNVICPECNIALPADFFARKADFDFTDKATLLTSSSNAGFQELIDNDVFTGIKESFAGEAWFAVKLAANTKITGYTLTASDGDAANFPKSWKLQGSLSGNSWLNIDTRENISFNPMETKIFEIPFNNVGDLVPYRNFRLLVNANNGGGFVELNEWQLLGFESIIESDVTNNGGTVTGQYPGYPGELVENLIDNNQATKYCVVDKGPVWIQYDSPAPVKIKSYRIHSCIDLFDRNLRAWQILGSENGATWEILDERENQDFMTRYHVLEFPTRVNKAFSHFRLNIQEIYTGTTFQIAEWQLFEGEPNTAIENPKTGYKVFSRDRKIIICSDEKINLPFDVYNLFGSKIKNGICSDATTEIAVNNGLYFVQVGNAGNKILVR